MFSLQLGFILRPFICVRQSNGRYPQPPICAILLHMSKRTPPSRPTSLAEYQELFQDTANEDQVPPPFQAQPSDIIITPYAKSGTTWLQQIVHSLRSRGDMNFDDISRVVPWIEVSHELGIDINAPQKWQPRAFKSHANWHNIAKGARYIISIRNPKDALVSSYRFLEGWYFEPGAFSITEYAHAEFLNPPEGKGYWNHLLSWWSQRDNENVLLFSFESMKADLPRTVQRVADFIGITLDDELFDIVVRQASFDFMLAHKDRFDDYLMRKRSEQLHNFPPNSDSSKVRKGEVGSHIYELTDALHQEIDAAWQQTIQKNLGFESYAAFRQVLDAYPNK